MNRRELFSYFERRFGYPFAANLFAYWSDEDIIELYNAQESIKREIDWTKVSIVAVAVLFWVILIGGLCG